MSPVTKARAYFFGSILMLLPGGYLFDICIKRGLTATAVSVPFVAIGAIIFAGILVGVAEEAQKAANK